MDNVWGLTVAAAKLDGGGDGGGGQNRFGRLFLLATVASLPRPEPEDHRCVLARRQRRPRGPRRRAGQTLHSVLN